MSNYSLKIFHPFALFKVKEWTPLVFKEFFFFFLMEMYESITRGTCSWNNIYQVKPPPPSLITIICLKKSNVFDTASCYAPFGTCWNPSWFFFSSSKELYFLDYTLDQKAWEWHSSKYSLLGTCKFCDIYFDKNKPWPTWRTKRMVWNLKT